nr:peroxide stress protein YaaA [uncultured Christiangramia sp.]
MGTKLATKSGKSLYDFWGHQLSKALMLELESHIDSKIINCASVEYFKALDNPELEASVITPVFKEIKNGKRSAYIDTGPLLRKEHPIKIPLKTAFFMEFPVS